MNKTLIASAVALTFGASAPVWANPTNTNAADSNDAITQEATATSTQTGGTGSALANEYSSATVKTRTDSSTTTKTDNSVSRSNNTDTDTDNSTSKSNNTKTWTDNSIRGDAEARSGGVAANNGATASLLNTKVVALSRLSGTVTGNTIQNIGNHARNSGDANGGHGGKGGTGNGGTGNGGVGNGGVGGAGGTNTVNAGTFNMSNTLSGSLNQAAGISVATQNTGIGALVQQSVNVQANLNIGR